MSSPALLLVDDANNAAAAAAAAASAATSTAGGPSTGLISTGSVNHIIVHSVVLLHVLDHHSRRQDVDGRVIGTLLGRRIDGTYTIEVTNCFAVPHAEHGDEVAIGKDYNKKMLNLYKRTNRKEFVVGWYATAAGGNTSTDTTQAPTTLVADTSSLIHEFYAGESDEDEPVHLVFDTRLLLQQISSGPIQPSISIRAYKSLPVIVQGEHLGNMFHELHLSLHSNEPEAICFHEMMKTDGLTLKYHDDKKNETTNGINTNSTAEDALQETMEKLYETLSRTLDYVDSVIDGKIPADAEIGRQIADTLATVPRVRPEIFDQLFHNSLQDLLMVTYLSNITRTQITISEKLNASLGV